MLSEESWSVVTVADAVDVLEIAPESAAFFLARGSW